MNVMDEKDSNNKMRQLERILHSHRLDNYNIIYDLLGFIDDCKFACKEKQKKTILKSKYKGKIDLCDELTAWINEYLKTTKENVAILEDVLKARFGSAFVGVVSYPFPDSVTDEDTEGKEFYIATFTLKCIKNEPVMTYKESKNLHKEIGDFILELNRKTNDKWAGQPVLALITGHEGLRMSNAVTRAKDLEDINEYS